MYSTNQPREQLSLEQAVLAYRNEYLVERSLGRLKGRPLSLTPMYVQRDDHATGLIRLLSLALRVLTLLEFVGRRRLAVEGTHLAGLYAGNAKRETARPTAERLLEAFQDLTLTVIEGPHQTYRHLTALNPDIEQVCEVEKPFILLFISRRSNGTQGRSDNGIGHRGTFGPFRAHC